MSRFPQEKCYIGKNLLQIVGDFSKLFTGAFLRGKKKRGKGSILIVSIWMLVIFSIFAVGLYRISLSQIDLSRRFEALTMSRYAAQAVYKYAMWELSNDQTNYDTLWELSQQGIEELGLTEFIYELIDEESKININTMSEEILERLPGIGQDVARIIIESSLRPFYAKEELLSIDGIDEDLFSEFSDFITVHSNGKVNINTACSEVLSSLELENDLVDIIMLFRAGIDGEAGTEDDGAFESSGGILQTLESFAGLTQSQEAQLLNIADLLDVRGESFLLNIEIKVLGRQAMKYGIVINKEKIIQWRER